MTASLADSMKLITASLSPLDVTTALRAARSDTEVISLLTLLGSDSLTVVLDFVSEGLLVLTPLFYREGWLCLRVYDFSNGDFSFFDGEVFVGLGDAFFG